MFKSKDKINCFLFYLISALTLAFGTSMIFGQVGDQEELAPSAIPQFVDPLPHFAGLRVNAMQGGNLTIKAVPSQQVAVSTGTELSTGTVGEDEGVGLANVWVYQISKNGHQFTPPLWPAFTIEAERGRSLNVHYINELYGETYENVGLSVDQTLHWADPLGQMPLMTPYEGAPPICVHLHGGEVPPTSDGGPDAWFTPGNAITGHAFNPDPYYYPNTQEAATLWFHDHGLGVTRLNVYAGMAGFYFLRDPHENALRLPGWSGDGKVQEASGGFRGKDKYLAEIEIAIQDRMFDDEGKLYFPNYPPNPLVHPTWTPEFVGNVITVNGKTWPYLSVAPRKYRFRILDGSNARFYNLTFPNGGPTITQIGTDGGFLDAPVPLGNGPLLIAPGERADVIIDFTNLAGQEFILENDAKSPYPDGDEVEEGYTDRIMKFTVDGQMYGPDKSVIPASLKTNVKLTNFEGVANPAIPEIAKTRQLTLNEVIGTGGPLEVLVNNTKWSGLSEGTTVRPDFTPVTIGTNTTYYSETMLEGTTEIWQIINLTADAHPIHLHLVQFQLMSRQPFDQAGYEEDYNDAFGGDFIGAYGPPNDYNVANSDGAIGGNPAISSFLTEGPARPANPNERGWKDTFIMYPGEVTTVIARWAPTDAPANADPSTLWFAFNPNDGGHGYVWHCHIIDHEDNEMMRPYNVTPNPLGPWAAPTAPIVLGDPGENSNTGNAGLPSSFELSQNYPNPFNPTTEIHFALPEANHVSLKVYNVVGQEVATLINADAPAGYHTVRLDARDLASGLYIYRIVAGDFVQSKKMVLMK